ncbi:hypothetical protein [Lacinutrix sp. 5H-3-7-4]|uniref:hypothetical protein n=1 Tax=Lacinutrix sp. (strain 5H-3-7-4) TaxID=983544 RepID=UPI00020A3DCA|nr:hypothetical protein [Lacinutrix sp. 5H-3-7-4]AEH01538.1 hypothetical protein Lacal_1690 [Lacinutrix sp. 5H-3-7-4]
MKYSLVLLFSVFSYVSFSQNFSNDSQLQVTRYKLQPEELNLQQDINAEKINLKIYYLKDSSIVEDYHFFNPKTNEILFFYGMDTENNKSEMFFKADDNLKSIYKKKDFEQLIKVVEILEYNVFPTEVFSSAEAYVALEQI